MDFSLFLKLEIWKQNALRANINHTSEKNVIELHKASRVEFLEWINHLSILISHFSFGTDIFLIKIIWLANYVVHYYTSLQEKSDLALHYLLKCIQSWVKHYVLKSMSALMTKKKTFLVDWSLAMYYLRVYAILMYCLSWWIVESDFPPPIPLPLFPYTHLHLCYLDKLPLFDGLLKVIYFQSLRFPHLPPCTHR